MSRKIAQIFALVVAIIIIGILIVPSQAAEEANAAPQLDSEEQAFVTLINNFRAQNGVAPLSIDWNLEAASDWMSNDMGRNEYVSHTDSLGRDTWTRMCDFDFCANTWKGEVIAAGYIRAQEVFDGWRSSPEHSGTMLGANYTVIGVSRAFTAGSHYDWYWTADFGGVQTSTTPPATPVATASPVPLTATPAPITPAPSAVPTVPPSPPPAPTPVPVPGVCPPLSGAQHSNANGPLVISSPGTYNGDGQTIVGGENNVSIQASNVTLCNYTLREAQGASVNIEDVSNIVLGRLNIQDFNQSGEGGNDSGGPQYVGGVACWYCTRLTVVDSVIATGKYYGNGIWVKRTNAGQAGPDYFAGNTIIGGWDGFGSEPEGDPNGGFGTGTIIENNTVTGCHDDGIQVEGRDENITIRNNEVTGCGTGIAVAPVLVGPVNIENNYIHDLIFAPSTAFFCFKLGASQGSSTPTITFTGNICIAPGAGGFEQTNEGLSYNIIATHNCIQDGLYVIDFNEEPGPGTFFDYNTFYTTDPERFAKWAGDRYDLSGLRSLGQELHGVEAQGCPAPAPIPTPRPALTAAPTPVPTAVPTLPPPPAPTFTPPPAPTAVPTPLATPATPQRSRGDANCDAQINAQDVIRVLQTASRVEHGGSPACVPDLDLNCDGRIGALDGLAILLWLTGQPADLPSDCAGVIG